MKVIIVKYIKATLGPVSPSDAILYKIISEDKVDFPLKKNKIVTSTFYPFLNGLEISHINFGNKATIVYTLPDRTFELKATSPFDDFSNTLDFKLKVSMHTKNFRFTLKPPVEIAENILSTLRKNTVNKKKGYVWNTITFRRKLEEYQGGFSDAMFIEIKKHITDTKDIPGWLNSITRTFEVDKAIEKNLKKLNLSVERTAKWLVSKDSRFITEIVLGKTDKLRVKLIELNINKIFNKALIRGAYDNSGSIEDYIRIGAEFRALGILRKEEPLILREK